MQLKQGKIDATLLALPIKEDFLVTEKIFDDEFKLAVAIDNPSAKKKIIKSTDLRHQQILLLDEGHSLRNQALQICQIMVLKNNRILEQQDLKHFAKWLKRKQGLPLCLKSQFMNPKLISTISLL